MSEEEKEPSPKEGGGGGASEEGKENNADSGGGETLDQSGIADILSQNAPAGGGEAFDDSGVSEVLSQGDVEDILASIGEEGFSDVRVLSRKGTQTGGRRVEEFDLRSPVFLTPSEMRRLRIKSEEFCRELGAAVSVYLRMEFMMQMSRLETLPYHNLIENLPMPSHITLFKMHPLQGICLLEMSPRLGLTVLDRMMGGPGHSVKNERDFTDIELTVLEDFIKLILKGYADSWHEYQRLDAEVIGHENTARFLSVAEESEIMLFLETEARIGDCMAGLRFIVPYRMLEGLIIKMMSEISNENDEAAQTPQNAQIASSYSNIPVPVTAFWKGFTMTLGEVDGMREGDVLVLNNRMCEEVVVELGHIPKFKGILDRSQGGVKVTLTSKME